MKNVSSRTWIFGFKGELKWISHTKNEFNSARHFFWIIFLVELGRIRKFNSHQLWKWMSLLTRCAHHHKHTKIKIYAAITLAKLAFHYYRIYWKWITRTKWNKLQNAILFLATRCDRGMKEEVRIEGNEKKTYVEYNKIDVLDAWTRCQFSQ